MPYDAAVLLLHTGQKSRDVLQGNQRNIKSIAEAYEARSLDACVDVQHAGQKGWLIRNDAHWPSVHACKADNDITGKVLVHLEEITVINQPLDDHLHVVWLARFCWNNRVKLAISTIRRIGAAPPRRIIEIVRRHEPQQLSYHRDALTVVVRHE